MEPPERQPIKALCGNCTHFQNDPAFLETVYAGMTSMGSGFASVRAQDGICNLHGIYLSCRDSCPRFSPGGGR